MELGRILIYAEQNESKLNPAAYELLTKARSLFGQEARVAFAVAGSGIDSVVGQLEESGADAVYYMDDKRLEQYHPDYFTAAACAAVKEFDPDVLLIGATPAGEELAPTLGSKLNTGVAAHCVDLAIKDGVFMQMVPAFGGKVVGEIYIPKHRPQIASVKPGIFSAEAQTARACEAVALPVAVLDEVKTSIKVVGAEQISFDGIPVEGAELIVCGGYGVGNKQNWDELERLASLLGAAVGYTRPVIDNGWVQDERGMIGTSGKSVRPKVYLGFGISGATHHVCGMKNADTIISVNRDKDAEIFDASNYKAVADSASVIAEMFKLLEK